MLFLQLPHFVIQFSHPVFDCSVWSVILLIVAVDRVNHYKLFRSDQYCRHLIVVDLLSNWYSKLFCVIKWNGSVLRQFMVGSGVRQGGCLSPSIFDVFMNAFVVKGY